MRKTEARICNWTGCNTRISSPVRYFCLVHTAAIATAARYLRLLSPEEQVKSRARRLALTARDRGDITQLPCAQCGDTRSEMHHPDYDQPLLVVWLCRTCHSRHHRQRG